jgi:xylulokinase
MIRGEPGQAELPSETIWRRVKEVLAECATKTSKNPIEAISAASMGEALVPVDAKGAILGDSLSGMDSRGAEYVQKLQNIVAPGEIYAISGNMPGPGFSLPNLAWLKAKRPDEYRKAALYMPWADFVCYKLSGVPKANLSLANRTLLLDLGNVDGAKAGVSRRARPRKAAALGASDTSLGESFPKWLPRCLPPDVRVVLGTHDQCSGALGSGVDGSGAAMSGSAPSPAPCWSTRTSAPNRPSASSR